MTSGLTGGPFAVQVDLETRTPDPFPSSVKLAESNAKLRESHERAKCCQVHETMMMEMAEKANLKQTRRGEQWCTRGAPASSNSGDSGDIDTE